MFKRATVTTKAGFKNPDWKGGFEVGAGIGGIVGVIIMTAVAHRALKMVEESDFPVNDGTEEEEGL